MFFLWMLYFRTTAAADFTPSSYWRKPDIIDSPEDRMNIVSAALGVALAHLNEAQLGGDYGSTGFLFAEMAEFDIASNQTRYKDQLKLYLSTVEQAQPSFKDEFAYGYAAMRAYAAYADQDFLVYAQDNWQYGRQYTVSDSDVAAGLMASKNFSISVNCQGVTMAGGTFWKNDRDTPLLNAAGTGFTVQNSWFNGQLMIYHPRLSAALAEATNNQTYLEAAAQSIEFIHNQLHNAQYQNTVEDGISAKSNDSCSKSTNLFVAYNAGLAIEGLAIYAFITQDATKQQLLEDMVSAAIFKADSWQDNDGVIRTGSVELVRALATVYNRNPASSDMRKLIKQYLGVQYNAVTELATSNGTNVYGNSWLGPPSSEFDPPSQVAALGALIATIPLTNDNGPDTSSSTLPIETGVLPSNPKSSKISGKAIGGIVGGIVSFILTIGFLLVLLRKKQQIRQSQSSMPVPFSLKDSNQEQSSGIKGSLYTQPSTRQTDEDVNSSESPPLSREKVPTRNPMPQRHRPSSSLSPSESRALIRSQEASLDPPPRNTKNPRNDITTAELVTILNERLQYGQWREDEVPPEYPGSSRMKRV
ncbi:hypothetical protein VKT23_018927 [Stygiomarasmius scandens]|uniref:Glycoside hydrolase family 76 protein n=1 Tax=Marasmiellus scandens TaxID=2682957 RepID=A0ABR1ISC1_9AGAR